MGSLQIWSKESQQPLKMLLSEMWSWLLAAISSSTNTSSISTLSMSKNASILSTATTTSRPLMIAVEGNIASGKSTFLNLLAERPEVAIFPLPAPVVRINGNGDLADFKKEVDKFAA